MIKNTSSAYGLVTKILHIVIAVMIIALLAVGLFMSDLPATDPNKFFLYGLHKSFGVAVLVLMAARLGWRLYSPVPHQNPTHKKWEANLARWLQYIFYAVGLLMPLSGWLMSNSFGYPVAFFGLTLPSLVNKNLPLAEFLGEVHEYMGWALIGLIALHSAGALKHHFIDKDDTLKRMFFFGGKK